MHRNENINFNVGLDSRPYNNPTCFVGVDQTGWYNCDSVLTGTYFGISKTDNQALTLSEVWAFSYPRIQNYQSVTLTTTHSGSAAANAL